jgi:hypothetical protein
LSTLGAVVVGWRAARQAKTRTAPRSATGLAFWGAVTKLLAALGTVLGLACFVVAAWIVAIPLGLLVAGVSLFVLEWRLTE